MKRKRANEKWRKEENLKGGGEWRKERRRKEEMKEERERLK